MRCASTRTRGIEFTAVGRSSSGRQPAAVPLPGASAQCLVYVTRTSVGIPILMGRRITLQKALVLFHCARNATVDIVDRWHYR